MDLYYHVFLYFIVIWVSLILIATALQLLGVLKENWKNLSIIENFRKIFKWNIEKHNESDKIKDILNLFILSRVITQLSVSLNHYFIEHYIKFSLKSFNEMPSDNVKYLVEYIAMFSTRIGLFYAFFINGNNAFKFTSNDSSSKIETNWKWIAKYYFGKFTQIAPLYYVLIVFNNFYLKYLISDSMKDPLMERVCRESVVSNMLFISNFSRPDRMVRNNLFIIEFLSLIKF